MARSVKKGTLLPVPASGVAHRLCTFVKNATMAVHVGVLSCSSRLSIAASSSSRGRKSVRGWRARSFEVQARAMSMVRDWRREILSSRRVRAVRRLLSISRRRVTVGVARGRRTEFETVRRSWRTVIAGLRVVRKERSGSDLGFSRRRAASLALGDEVSGCVCVLWRMTYASNAVSR